MFLAVINAIFLAYFANKAKSILIYIYTSVNFLLFLLPYFIGEIFGIHHPLYRPEHEAYFRTGMVFILLYNIVLCVSFLGFSTIVGELSLLRRSRQDNDFDNPDNIFGIYVLSAIALCVAAVGKVALQGLGAYRMLDTVTPSAALQLFTMLAQFDLFVLVYLGELRNRAAAQKASLNVLYGIVIAGVILSAAFTGSRYQVILALLLIGISNRRFLRRHLVATTAMVILIVPNVVVVFPLLSFYRTNGYQMSEAVERVADTVADRPALMLDIATTRLNYMQIYGMTIDHVKTYGPAGGAVYWNNVIGLVPRVLWPEKPQITNESHQLGHSLGVLTRDDTKTSIGLQVIGEAFYELGWGGLIIAVFQGLLFAFVERQGNHPTSPMYFGLYIYMALYLVSRDGYFAVIPGFIIHSMGIVTFVILATFCLNIESRRLMAPPTDSAS